ncbi:MAG TPA: hypothetical protein PK156_28995 [Polyangium sp.]|nr:hypothetical protein [Polyangium sp.]
MKTQSWTNLNRSLGGVVASIFVGLMTPACNTVLGTDSFRAEGCPNAGGPPASSSPDSLPPLNSYDDRAIRHEPSSVDGVRCARQL